MGAVGSSQLCGQDYCADEGEERRETIQSKRDNGYGYGRDEVRNKTVDDGDPREGAHENGEVDGSSSRRCCVLGVCADIAEKGGCDKDEEELH